MIEKRFPADCTLSSPTFLNDKRVNGELYAFLQSYSYANERGQTLVYKKSLPKQGEICEKIGIKSPKTFRAHMAYLIDSGYVIEEETYYILPEKEEIFLMIPLKTLQFFNDTLREQVVKIYVYLGQRWKYKKGYEFTIAELAAHVGIKLEGNSRGYEIIENALECLSLLGVIRYVTYWEGQKPRRRLVDFSFEIGKNSK